MAKKGRRFVDDLPPSQDDTDEQVEVLSAYGRCADSEVLIKALEGHQHGAPEGSTCTGAEDADRVRVQRMVEAMSISIPDNALVALRKPAELVNEELCRRL